MAIYTAKKVNPRTENGLFKIDVEIYADGVLVKTETFETSQDQPADWPADGVKRLIQSLQAVPTLPGKITTGDVTLPADPIVDVAANAWLADYALYQRVKPLVDAGVIAANNTKYTALLTRLKNNFQPAYVGLV